jgi:phosphoheptose isomerase
MIDLENFESKFTEIVGSSSWQTLQRDFDKSPFVFYIGNGGNLAVASHAASDASRLTNKNVMAPEDSIALTALMGDVGYREFFKTWIEGKSRHLKASDCLVIGLSCSKESQSALGIMESLHWCAEQGMKTAVLSAGPKNNLHPTTTAVIQNTKFHHTSEILSLALSYQLIKGSGFELPCISK